MTKKIISGNRGVIITSNDEDGPFSCRVWVNVRNGFDHPHADATLICTERTTLKSAIKWAEKQLAA